MQPVVSTIRVALVSMRPKLRDILTDVVAREQDMELIHCQIASDAELAAARPNVLVCEIADPLDVGLPARLLRAVPGARVLMIADKGDRAALYELRPARKMVQDVSIKQVIDAIRFGLGQVGDSRAPEGQSVHH